MYYVLCDLIFHQLSEVWKYYVSFAVEDLKLQEVSWIGKAQI